MARLEQVHPAMRAALLAMACPTFDTQPWVVGPVVQVARALHIEPNNIRIKVTAAAQPGHSTVDSTILADWFWRDTTAGRVLFAVQEISKQSAVPGMQVVATGLLIPRARSAESPFARA